MTPPTVVLEVTDVVKGYGALRPLRLKSLRLIEGERLAVSGIDAPAGEMLVNLVTGATLPDQGAIRTFGRSTADIASGDDWIASLDRFGIVSDRAVLLEGATLAQNLALPFTLSVDPIAPEVMERVTALADECSIPAAALASPAGSLTASLRARAHVARALALGPQLIVLEHPTASVTDRDRAVLGRDLARIVERRRAAALAITLDDAFARAFADRTLSLNAATGELKEKKRGWW